MNRSLKTYQGQDIRNVALVGHAHCGKTTLISALLQAAKMTERLGRVDDGSAVTAYDEEDVARRTTMQNALAFAEWHNVKINFVDTPGFPMFVHEARAALLPVEAALLVVNAACGVEAMTRRVWKFGEEFNLPRAIVINQMDHPRADRERTLNALREAFGRQVVPVQLPILEGNGQNPSLPRRRGPGHHGSLRLRARRHRLRTSFRDSGAPSRRSHGWPTRPWWSWWPRAKTS